MSNSENITSAFDVGNGHVKVAQNTPDNYYTIPSSILELDPWEIKDINLDDKSRTVYYESGSNENLKGKAWLIGNLASSMGGESLYVTEKHNLCAEMVLAQCLPSDPSIDHVILDTIYYSIPDDLKEDQVHFVRNALRGTHHIKLNGRPLTVDIKDVDVTYEGKGAYYFIKYQNLLKYPHLMFGIWDIGTKTSIINAYAPPSGGQKDHTLLRRQRDVFYGVYSLAERIAGGADLRNLSLEVTPNTDLILEGIKDGTLEYSTTGISFERDFHKYSNEWLEKTLRKIRLSWRNIGSKMAELVIVGGGATLATPLRKEGNEDRFIICPEPQFANVRGMLAHGLDLI